MPNREKVKPWVAHNYGDRLSGRGLQWLSALIVKANDELRAQHASTRKADERRLEIARMVQDGEFLSAEESAAVYKGLGSAQQKTALLNSYGYLTTGHFSLNQTRALNPGEPTNTLALGEIKVGTAYVSEAIGRVQEILNEQVYEIFQSLKTLSDSINAYFAGGLKNDSEAGSAISNAENIVSRTEDIREK